MTIPPDDTNICRSVPGRKLQPRTVSFRFRWGHHVVPCFVVAKAMYIPFSMFTLSTFLQWVLGSTPFIFADFLQFTQGPHRVHTAIVSLNASQPFDYWCLKFCFRVPRVVVGCFFFFFIRLFRCKVFLYRAYIFEQSSLYEMKDI